MSIDFKEKIKVKHIAFTDINGGAARAAYRVHKSLINEQSSRIISSMRVIKKFSDDYTVKGGPPNQKKLNYFFYKLLNKISKSLYKSSNPNYFSTAWPSKGLAIELNKLFCDKKIDLVNLHWLGDGTLSIKEIGQLKMPIVWRLADQWAFCACEHYSEFDKTNLKNKLLEKYITGYSFDKKDLFNINYYLWTEKLKYWKGKINIVAPSNWIADCARKSYLFRNSNITVIPTPLDLEKWVPISKAHARELINLPKNKKLILYGAQGGTQDPRKGSEFLFKALEEINNDESNPISGQFELIVFGQSTPKIIPNLNFKVRYLGHFNDDISLRIIYSAADLFVISSVQDNLPGTGLEAHACGTPVIAFDIGGLSDIIEHHKTGGLVKDLNYSLMAKEITWLIENNIRHKKLCESARERAVKLWNQKRIAKLYSEFYFQVLNQ